MKKKFKVFLFLLLEAVKESIRDRILGMSSALAYLQLLSMAPLVGFLLFIFSKILGESETQQEIGPILKVWFPEQFLKVIRFMLTQSEKLDPADLSSLSWIAGIILGLATKEYFGVVRDSLGTIWNDRREKFGFKPILKDNLGDMKVTVISLIIVFFFLFIRYLFPHPLAEPHQEFSGTVLIIIKVFQRMFQMFAIFFIALYFFTRVVPLKIKWKDAVPGALMYAIMEIVGREVMKYHLEGNPDAEIAELLIVIMVWFYYSNLMLIFSAQFSKAYIVRKYNIDVLSLNYK